MVTVIKTDRLGRETGATAITRELAAIMLVNVCKRAGKSVDTHHTNLFHSFSNTSLTLKDGSGYRFRLLPSAA